jgi:uncharacterized protein YciI
MFIVILRFSDNQNRADELREAHRAALKRGFDDGVYLVGGGLHHHQGGALLAHNTSLEELQARVNADPFVAENVTRAEILEFTAAMADERLNFLIDT